MPGIAVDGGVRADSLLLTGGSFWSLEYHLTGAPGVVVEPGYAGNHAWKPVDVKGKPNPRPNFYNLNGTGFSEAVRVAFRDPASLREVFARHAAHLAVDQTEVFNATPDHVARYRRALVAPDARVRSMAVPALRATGLGSVSVELGSLFFPAEPRWKGYWLKDREPFRLVRAARRDAAE